MHTAMILYLTLGNLPQSTHLLWGAGPTAMILYRLTENLPLSSHPLAFPYALGCQAYRNYSVQHTWQSTLIYPSASIYLIYIKLIIIMSE